MKKKVEEDVPSGAMTSDGVMGSFNDDPKFSAKNVVKRKGKKPIIKRRLNESDDNSFNSHIVHLEEFLFDSDEPMAVYESFCESLIDGHIGVTVKVDGAPALFFGHDDGEFFISTKSICNKVPKIIKSLEDIETIFESAPEGLKVKFRAAYTELKEVAVDKSKIYQGDVMFTKEDIIKHGDGDEASTYVSFTPNTIEYKADMSNPDIWDRINNSDLGIIIHTEYINKGRDENGKFLVNRVELDREGLNLPSDKFIMTSEIIHSNDAEVPDFEPMLESLEFDTSMPAKVKSQFKIYINKCIKDDTPLNAEGFRPWLEAKLDKKAATLKSENGKIKAASDKRVLLESIPDLEPFINAHNLIMQFKLDYMDALNQKSEMLLSDIHEGYVIDCEHGLIKLVDRYEFSHRNFNNDKFG